MKRAVRAPHVFAIVWGSILSVMVLGGVLHASAEDQKSVHQFTVNTIEGNPLSLSEFKGKVLLIVNTASKCGFTVQYADLQKLYEEYEAKGFSVLGFPSNDFANQEPGTDKQIREFCRARFGVTFPMFCRGSVTGPEKQALFKLLTEQSGEEFAGEISWNFEKFLVDRKGRVRARFGSFTNPTSSSIREKIETLLKEDA